MTETATSTTKPNTFPCKNCGAQLTYDAAKQSMLCAYCGTQQEIPQTQSVAEAIREIPIEEGYQLAARGLGVQVTTINCSDCGATVNVGEGERTAQCAFCSSNKVLPIETDANAIRPESLVAFKVDREAANNKFSEWIKKLWFRPNNLKRMAKVHEIGGVYVPFWTFDAHVDSHWTADAGYYYYETEYYTEVVDGERVERSREVQRVRWEPAWGNRSDFYDDVLVCASKGLPQELVSKFSTFDTNELIPYAPHYLAGWKAEAYAIEFMDAHAKSQETIESEQRSRCGGDVPGDTHRNLSVQNHFYQETFKHILLPIWIAAYRYNNKVYRFLVNGQTGEVVGKAPYSFWKIFLFVLACVVALSGIGYLVYASNESKEHDRKEQQQKRKHLDEDNDEDRPRKKKRHSSLELYKFHHYDCLWISIPV